MVLLVTLSLLGGPISAVAATTGERLTSGWRSLLVDSIATIAPAGLLRLIEGSQALSTGNDGRLTFLLLGSDTRGGGVERTDTIMVASLRGSTISVLSIPRDTARIPNPDGGTFSGKINSILRELRRALPPEQAMAKFEEVIEHLLQIEIDYHALIKFDGFQHFVEEIEPVSVDIGRPVADARYWDDPAKLSGVYFPAANNYDLYAWQPGPNPLCNGLWRNQAQPIPSNYWCRRAMPFVRSRKGASDFVRARRQQDFVIASMRRVINRGGGALGSLVSRAAWETGKGTLATNLPLNVSTALDLYQQLSGAGVGIQVVLAPPKYATHIPGSTAYEMDLAAVRQLTREWFGGSDNPQVPPATTLPTAAPTFGATAGPTTMPTVPPTPAPGTTAQPTNPPPTLVAGASPSGEPVAVVPQPSSPATPPQSAPLGSGSLPVWLVVLAVVFLGVAALILFWTRKRQAR